MKIMWNVINRIRLKKHSKNRLFLGAMILINIIIGAAVWLLVGRLFFSGMDCFLCFMGYPAIIIGFLGGVIYLYNHEFETYQ